MWNFPEQGKTRKIMVYARLIEREISIVHDESKKSVSRVRGGLTYLKGHCIPPYTRGTRLYECLPITGSLDTDCVVAQSSRRLRL